MLLLLSFALADSVTLTPVAGVVTPSTFKPGLRVGWELDPRLALEAVGVWDGYRAGDPAAISAGLGLTGRAWFAGQPGHGVYLHGRAVVGIGIEEDFTRPWGGLQGGFGARPRPWIGVEAAMGPEYGLGLPVWRSELSLTFVFGDSLRKQPGSGSVRHHPRPVP